MLFCWFISPTLLHNAMRKFGTFFWASRYIHTPWPCTNRGSVQWADLNWPQRSALTEYNSIVEASKSWHLYLVPQSQRNATTAPGGIHDCPNRWVFSRRWNVFSDSLLSRSADGRLLLFHTLEDEAALAHVAAFRNDSNSEAAVVENWDQILDILTRCKISGRGWLKMSVSVLPV